MLGSAWKVLKVQRVQMDREVKQEVGYNQKWITLQLNVFFWNSLALGLPGEKGKQGPQGFAGYPGECFKYNLVIFSFFNFKFAGSPGEKGKINNENKPTKEIYDFTNLQVTKEALEALDLWAKKVWWLCGVNFYNLLTEFVFHFRWKGKRFYNSA